ncbi:hypothetical protein CCP3SC15_3930004 [Gammaproteobacteria bacterium]
MLKLVTANYQGLAVSFTEDGWFNATEVAAKVMAVMANPLGLLLDSIAAAGTESLRINPLPAQAIPVKPHVHCRLPWAGSGLLKEQEDRTGGFPSSLRSLGLGRRPGNWGEDGK